MAQCILYACLLTVFLGLVSANSHGPLCHCYGPSNPQGPPGEPGIDGRDGVTGIAGIKGADTRRQVPFDSVEFYPGHPGPAGFKGDRGADGLIGETGVKGDDAEFCMDNLDCSDYSEKTTGVKGNKGVKGPKGRAGAPGRRGMVGSPARDAEIVDFSSTEVGDMYFDETEGRLHFKTRYSGWVEIAKTA